jgi:hypothetical protein
MKRLVEVTITKEIEIDIPEILLTEEHIRNFKSYIGLDNDVDDIPACQDELFKFVGRLAAMGDDDAEAMGPMGPEYMKKYTKHQQTFITLDEKYEDYEVRFL